MYLEGSLASLVVQMVKKKKKKKSACNAGDLGSIPGLGRSGGGHGNPLQFSCLENPHGQRSLAGCSPWGRKESDTTGAIKHSHWLPRWLSNKESGVPSRRLGYNP